MAVDRRIIGFAVICGRRQDGGQDGDKASTRKKKDNKKPEGNEKR